jgi:hypothetical protein
MVGLNFYLVFYFDAGLAKTENSFDFISLGYHSGFEFMLMVRDLGVSAIYLKKPSTFFHYYNYLSF